MLEINEEMLEGIILSIKPEFCELILAGNKPYEFRNFIPKQFSPYFFVYESAPSSALKYILKVAKPIKFPDQVEGKGFGNELFNNGQMSYKHAYKIEEIYSIAEPIPLTILREKFNFSAPQAYTYLKNNKELQSFLTGKNLELFIPK
ncbi:hypothetical protein ACWV26_09430 [Rummeliibacillus sp. JY-2-4R]